MCRNLNMETTCCNAHLAMILNTFLKYSTSRRFQGVASLIVVPMSQLKAWVVSHAGVRPRWRAGGPSLVIRQCSARGPGCLGYTRVSTLVLYIYHHLPSRLSEAFHIALLIIFLICSHVFVLCIKSVLLLSMKHKNGGYS